MPSSETAQEAQRPRQDLHGLRAAGRIIWTQSDAGFVSQLPLVAVIEDLKEASRKMIPILALRL